jgi:hypothetical protein
MRQWAQSMLLTRKVKPVFWWSNRKIAYNMNGGETHIVSVDENVIGQYLPSSTVIQLERSSVQKVDKLPLDLQHIKAAHLLLFVTLLFVLNFDLKKLRQRDFLWGLRNLNYLIL